MQALLCYHIKSSRKIVVKVSEKEKAIQTYEDGELQ